MPDRPNVLKAKIVSVSEPGKAVVFQFNPEDLAITRTIRWNEETNIGSDSSELSFAGGQSQDLTIPLLFDTTDTGLDVRTSYGMLMEMAMVNQILRNFITGMGEPPLCQFVWGKFLSFTAVITQITQRFTMFKADGTPVRARVEVTLKQVEPKLPFQNPTSRTETRKIWVVHEGQTLDWIAYQEYGDPAHWRHIAETNNLMNPKDLRPGQVLKLVPLP